MIHVKQHHLLHEGGHKVEWAAPGSCSGQAEEEPEAGSWQGEGAKGGSHGWGEGRESLKELLDHCAAH